MSSLSQFFGGGVKSIQTVDAAQSLTNSLSSSNNTYTWGANDRLDVTINPVDPNKTVLISDIGDGSTNGKSSRNSALYFKLISGHYAEIINSTTIRINGPSFTFVQNSNNFQNPEDQHTRGATIHIQVVEFN